MRNTEKSLQKAFRFNATDKELRTLLIENEPYFIAKDVCEVLELSHVSNTLSKLDDDEKLTVKLLQSGQHRKTWLINESGLYNLIFRSNKPQAKAFRKWVTSEVLPTLRKTGSYELPQVGQPKTGGFIDMRHVPYTLSKINDCNVRTILQNERDWYSINDLHTAIGVNTPSHQTAKSLNKVEQLAAKIFVFGNTHPAWFCTRTGLQLILSGSSYIKHNTNKLTLLLQPDVKLIKAI